MDDVPLTSPLSDFCYKMDLKLRNKNVDSYYNFVEKVDPLYIKSLLIADWRYRYAHQLNVLIEIYGNQGSGKSLFGQNVAIHLGKIFEMPFNMEQHTLADFDLLDDALHSTPYRTTFVVDEQPKSFYGYGSGRVLNSLKDFEEVCRYTMKNIIYISPSEREHSSYYMFKEDARPSVERFNNPKCLKCKRQADCLRIFSENKFKTMCGMPFYKRHGYPVAFNFMLIYPRKSDNNLMPRGYARFEVLPPKLMQKYDTIKQRNLNIFEKRENLGWIKQREQLKEFQDKYRDLLINDKGKVVAKDLIKAYLMDFFGGARNFTISELDLMTAVVKAEIRSKDFVDKTQEEFNKVVSVE